MVAINNKLEITVGQLVTERPGRARIFEAFGIDYCCGGKKPLLQAIREKGLDQNTVLRVLDTFDEQTPHTERDLSTASLTELADDIERYLALRPVRTTPDRLLYRAA